MLVQLALGGWYRLFADPIRWRLVVERCGGDHYFVFRLGKSQCDSRIARIFCSWPTGATAGSAMLPRDSFGICLRIQSLDPARIAIERHDEGTEFGRVLSRCLALAMTHATCAIRLH